MTRALYKKVMDDFLVKIGSGEIKVGDRLPKEEDYAAQLGVSRSTLRLAFTQLEKSGIIRRKKRDGTEVISDKPIVKYSMVSSGLYDIFQVVRDNKLILSDVQYINAKELDDLVAYQGISDHWMSYAGNRYNSEDRMPLSFSYMYVPSRYSDIDLHVGKSVEAVFKIIEQRFDESVGRVKQSISAVDCSEPIAEKLELNVGESLLYAFIEIFNLNDELIEFGHTYFNPRRVSVKSDVAVGN